MRRLGILLALALLLASEASAQSISVKFDYFTGDDATTMVSRYVFALFVDSDVVHTTPTPTCSAGSCVIPLIDYADGTMHSVYLRTACVTAPLVFGTASTPISYTTGSALPAAGMPVTPPMSPCADPPVETPPSDQGPPPPPAPAPTPVPNPVPTSVQPIVVPSTCIISDSKPDSRTGWSVQFWRDSAKVNGVDQSYPYSRTVAYRPGTHVWQAVWTRAGVTVTRTITITGCGG